MPTEVRQTFGFAIYEAQIGLKHENAKPLKGFGGAQVLEVVEGFGGNAYRAVYTVRFERAVYVLHVWQKKSTRGVETRHADIKLIRERLARAEQHYRMKYLGTENGC